MGTLGGKEKKKLWYSSSYHISNSFQMYLISNKHPPPQNDGNKGMTTLNPTSVLLIKLFLATFLFSNRPLGEMNSLYDSTVVQCGNAKMSSEEQELVTLYHHSFNDELVDLDLIMDLLDNICSSAGDGETQHSLSYLLVKRRLTFDNLWPSEHHTARFVGQSMMMF